MRVPNDISNFLAVHHHRKDDEERNCQCEESYIDQTLDDEEETLLQEEFEELDNVDCMTPNANKEPAHPASRFSCMQYGDLSEELNALQLLTS